MSVSALGCGEVAKTEVVDAADEPSEAKDVAAETQFTFSDAGATCIDAGVFVGLCNASCAIFDIKTCPDAGNCAAICGWNPGYCEIEDAALCATLLPDASFNDVDTYVLCQGNGRRPEGYREQRAKSVGGYFASLAHLEAASVFAFERVCSELEAMKAPRQLVARVKRSARDEVRHARTMTRIAKRFGGVTTAPRSPRFRNRNLERFAIENVVEGCVRETYGALVATWQSMHAKDERVRAAMKFIARDETRHATLAMRIASFVSKKLDAKSLRRVERAKTLALHDLRIAVSASPHAELVRIAGLPNCEQARALFDHVFTASI